MKTRHWVILFTVVVLISAGAFFFIGGISQDSKIASVYQGDVLINTIDLDKVSSAYSFSIIGENGEENVVLVEPGQISMQCASCPDQICVKHAPISDGVEPIVCLPNKVIIQIEKSSGDIAHGAVGG